MDSSVFGGSSWTAVAGMVVVSYLATHLFVVWLQQRRMSRIETKSLRLCGEGSSDGAKDGAQVPITVITGFLGSGKTTLVNRVLTSPEHGLRILVIENEIGAISIDHALIDQTRQPDMPDGVIVLKNGCMCCSGETPGSELERVLDKLLDMDRIDGGQSLPVDHILIETTGLADPGPIVIALCRREMETSRFFLDSVVTVVDAAHVMRHLHPSGPFAFARRRAEVEKQIALADCIVLNKIDLLASPDEKGTGGEAAAAAEEERIVRAMRGINASAALVRATHANVSLPDLFDQRAFSSAGWLTHLRAALGRGNAAATSAAAAAARAHEKAAAASKLASDPRHTATVRCITLELEDGHAIRLDRLQAWLRDLVERKHEDLYRVKGVLHIDGRDERFVLHGIHHTIAGHFERPWAPGEVRTSAVVLIGHSLERESIERGFLAAAAGEACCEAAEAETQEPASVPPNTRVCSTGSKVKEQ